MAHLLTKLEYNGHAGLKLSDKDLPRKYAFNKDMGNSLSENILKRFKMQQWRCEKQRREQF